MSSKPCLIMIRNKYNYLTPVQKKIADFVLSHYEEIPGMTVAHLAQASSTVDSAVIRFCYKLGYKSFADFKLSLAVELSSKELTQYNPIISIDDSVENVIDKIFTAGINTLSETKNLLDYKAVEKAVSFIDSASAIYIFGIGTSAPVANDAAYRIMELGYPVFHSNDSVKMRVLTNNIKPGDVVIGISHSGRTKETVKTLEMAKENGAKIICITSFSLSPIYEISDCPICIYSDEVKYPMEAVASRIAHMTVIDVITVALALRRKDEAILRSKKTRKILEALRYKKGGYDE